MSGRGQGRSKGHSKGSKSSDSDTEETKRLQKQIDKLKEDIRRHDERRRREKSRSRSGSRHRSSGSHRRSSSRSRSDSRRRERSRERKSRSKERKSRSKSRDRSSSWRLDTRDPAYRVGRTSAFSRLGGKVEEKPMLPRDQEVKIKPVPAGYEPEHVKYVSGGKRRRRSGRPQKVCDPRAHMSAKPDVLPGIEVGEKNEKFKRTPPPDCYKKWKDLSDMEQRVWSTEYLVGDGRMDLSSNMRLPEGLKYMLTFARETRIIRGEKPVKNLPKHLETGLGRDWRPVDLDKVKGPRNRLHARFQKCRPVIQIDDKTQIPLTWIASGDDWENAEHQMEQSINKLNFISLDLEDNFPDAEGQVCTPDGKVAGKKRFAIIGLPDPEVIIVDCHAVDLFYYGFPKEWLKKLQKKGCIFVGSEVQKDLPTREELDGVQLNWIDTRYIMQLVEKRLKDEIIDNRLPEDQGKPGLGSMSELLHGINYKSGFVNRPYSGRFAPENGRYPPDIYSPNGNPGKEFHFYLIRKMNMYYLQLNWVNAGVILAYMYNDALTPLAFIMRLASGVKGFQDEKQTVRNMLEPHFNTPWDPNEDFEDKFIPCLPSDIPPYNPCAMPEEADRPVQKPEPKPQEIRSWDEIRKEIEEKKDRERERKRQSDERKRKMRSPSHPKSLWSEPASSMTMEIEISSQDRRDFEEGRSLSGSPSQIKFVPRKKVSPEKSKRRLSPEKSKYPEPSTSKRPKPAKKVSQLDIETTNDTKEHWKSFCLPPTHCARCGKEKPKDGPCGCPQKKCTYVGCFESNGHPIKFCPYLGARCANCHVRGHTADHCEKYPQRQWVYVYEHQQAEGHWTAFPDRNVGVSVFPIPKSLRGRMMDSFTEQTILHNLYYPKRNKPRMSFDARFQAIKGEILTFCTTWEDEDQAARVSLEMTVLDVEQSKFCMSEAAYVKEWMTEQLQWVNTLYKKPEHWPEPMMDQWRKVFKYHLWTAGLPKALPTSSQYLVDELNADGLDTKKSVRVSIKRPYTLFECTHNGRMLYEKTLAETEKRRPRIIQRPQDVPVDLPAPSHYRSFREIVIPDTIYLSMEKRIKATKQALSASIKQSHDFEGLDEDYFY